MRFGFLAFSLFIGLSAHAQFYGGYNQPYAMGGGAYLPVQMPVQMAPSFFPGPFAGGGGFAPQPFLPPLGPSYFPQPFAPVRLSANFDLTSLFGVGRAMAMPSAANAAIMPSPNYSYAPTYMAPSATVLPSVPSTSVAARDEVYLPPQAARALTTSAPVPRRQIVHALEPVPQPPREVTESEGRVCVECTRSQAQTRSVRMARLPVQRAPEPRHVGAAAVAVTGGLTSPLPHAEAIQRAINSGIGLRVAAGLCGRAVWQILRLASLVRGGPNSGANAKYMGPVLARFGFKKDMRVCNRPGAVRIYDGNRSGRRFANSMEGDRWGHIEILGLDRGFHSFYNSQRSISQAMAARYGTALRRPLMECWYKP